MLQRRCFSCKGNNGFFIPLKTAVVLGVCVFVWFVVKYFLVAESE